MVKIRFFAAMLAFVAGTFGVAAAQAGADQPWQRQSAIGVGISPFEHGVRIDAIIPGSPAAAAGLQIGDVILRIDGRDADVKTFRSYIAAKSPGTEVSLEFQRGAEPPRRAVVATINRLTFAALAILDSQDRPPIAASPKASSALSDLAEANSPAPKMRDSTAALECTGEFVELVLSGFIIRLNRFPGSHPGELGIAPDQIVWVEDKTNTKPTLLTNRASVSVELKKAGRVLLPFDRLEIKAADKTYEMSAYQSGPDYCLRFSYLALQDLPSAEAQFVQLTHDLPVMRAAASLVALSGFQPKAVAWRAAGSKVDPPEEAQRHFVLAQQAFNDKDSNHQAEELTAALEIYPTWPDRQYDLALLLGELGRYSEAIEHMQMYLELSPNAPDAQKVKQQIWIWQDKVERPATLPAQVAVPQSGDGSKR